MDISIYSTRLLTDGVTTRITGTVNGVRKVVDVELGASPSLQDVSDALEQGAVWNATGGSLAAGTLVYVSGYEATEDKPKVSKADANAAGARAAMVLRSAVADAAGGYGYLTHRLTGVNTAGATVGDPVYLSETAGGWTLTAPSAKNSIKQIVGRVVVVDATVGEIEIDLTNNQVAFGVNELQQGFLKSFVATGGAAGDITVTGMAAGDEIVAVIPFPKSVDTGTDATGNKLSDVSANLASEFTAGAGLMNNAAGTSTANTMLLVLYVDRT